MKHYVLISSLLEPMILDPEESYTLGRSPENKIMLDSHLISRFHAKITWKEDHFVIWDKGSRNGSLLNNAPMEPGDIYYLTDKDEIQIEPFVLRFREAEGDLDLLITLEIERLKMVRLEDSLQSLQEGAVFQGSLLYYRLSYLLQILEAAEQTGVLELSHLQNKEGAIFWENGRIIDIERGSLRGLDAAQELFSLKEGYFQFTAGFPQREHTISTPTSQLMLKLFSQLHPRPQNSAFSEPAPTPLTKRLRKEVEEKNRIRSNI